MHIIVHNIANLHSNLHLKRREAEKHHLRAYKHKNLMGTYCILVPNNLHLLCRAFG